MSSRNAMQLHARTQSRDEPEVTDRILDAAQRYLQQPGARRVPMAELARQAGVSRPTVYRRFPDSDAVVRALWDREIARLLAHTPRKREDRESLVAQAVELADRISRHEALARTFTAEPELIAQYIVDRLGTGQRALMTVLREAVRNAQAGGTVRAGKPSELAAMTLLIAQSAIQSRQMIKNQLPGRSWRRELAHALDGYLRP